MTRVTLKKKIKTEKQTVVRQRTVRLDGDACRIRLKSDPVSAAS